MKGFYYRKRFVPKLSNYDLSFCVCRQWLHANDENNGHFWQGYNWVCVHIGATPTFQCPYGFFRV